VLDVRWGDVDGGFEDAARVALCLQQSWDEVQLEVLDLRSLGFVSDVWAETVGQ
jgi:hypothetical protein